MNPIKSAMNVASARPRIPWRRFVKFVAVAGLLACCTWGCVGRRQALVATQRLVLTSEQASTVVSQARTNEALAIEAQRAVRTAYRQLAEKTWQSLIESHQRTLEAEYQKSVALIESERARLLGERQKERTRTAEALDNKLKEALEKVDQSEAMAEKEAIEARKKSKEVPGDLPLLQKSLEADVVYFAVAAKARDMELRARLRMQTELDKVELAFHEQLENATRKQREKVLAVFTAAKDKLAANQPAPIDLGPEPEGNAAFHDSLIQYLASVQQAGRALEDYLESNWFGRRSFLVEFLRSGGSGLISGVFKPVANLKDAFGELRTAAKGLGQDVLTEVKDAGSAAKEALAAEGREIGKSLTGELLNKARNVIDLNRAADK